MAKIAVVETQKGAIKLQLFENKAPITTKNFIKLVEKGFYNGLVFHRVEPGFVVQTGDPTGTGTGGSGETIPLEINKTLTLKKGAVGMARKAEPDSASSQFYITLTDTPELDGNYAIFGQVISGMDVVEKIQKGDKIIRIRLE